LEEQKDDAKPLAPQEERNIVIASDMDTGYIRKELDEAKDKEVPIIWRVELRRGLETVKDEAGNDRDISVKSVIGVALDRSEIPY
jgi:hypothetical protein